MQYCRVDCHQKNNSGGLLRSYNLEVLAYPTDIQTLSPPLTIPDRVWLISGRLVLIAFIRLKSASFLS